ncbi:hypothetical protein HF329_15075 [Chitinophaga oryzae]|uniref:Substrate import-associated zinc metallohydrolase lipoprotein n=1 Tax=Chitinophaga oryzae TaxID=2725414 RepID=A0AAE6ZIY0_9BACT|nr:substrate import-associated zinc metallohydrolase lipoprotein [Chitinophaga oryzae]QJB32574.1 hypothetical protein HF329_15075 [Chitinophaga oryzae]
MKYLKLFISLLIVTGAWAACNRKETLDTNIVGLGGDTWVKDSIDKWLYDSLLKPYNIEMKYKWDQSEFDMSIVLVPPYRSKVIPVTKDVVSMWINPYRQIGGDAFIKSNLPRLIMLAGSDAIQADGGAVHGLAESGLKILLFGLNLYNNKDSVRVVDMAHLIHHEYTHILNQKKAYPVEFNKVTPDGYTSNWSVAQENSWTLGFVSDYSRKEPAEDIAELVATMLVMGRSRYDSTLYHPFENYPDSLNNPDGIRLLRAKEKIVVDYFKDAYNLDFYALQTLVQQEIHNVLHR